MSYALQAEATMLSRDREISPLVTILVVVRNDVCELKCLLENLSLFRSDQAELIIVDGGSEDGSVDLLRLHDRNINRWISEPDTGLYDAMNKGIAIARGHYILHINAGDRLLHLPLTELQSFAERRIDVVCYRVLEDGHHLYIPRNDWLLCLDNTWHHQGTFYARRTHLGYNQNYPAFGDFDHNQRLCRAGASVLLLDAIISTHETNGLTGRTNKKELYRVIKRNVGSFYVIPSFCRFSINKLRALFLRMLRRKTDAS